MTLRFDASSTLRQRSGVQVVDVEDARFLWSAGALHRLNHTGSAVWELLDGHQTVEEVSATVAAWFGVTPSRILGDVLALCEQLDEAGLLAGSSRTATPAHAPMGLGPAVGPREQPGPPPPEERAEFTTSRFLALDFDFAIRSTDRRMIDHLGAVLEAMSAKGSARHIYRVVDNGPTSADRFALYLDDLPLVLCTDQASAVRHVLWHVNSEVIRQSSAKVLIHAAGAVVGRAGVLMPAPMDSGKTTLVAGLVRSGAAYLTDELVALGADRVMHPYPRPMNLGAGSWPLLPEFEPVGWWPRSEGTPDQWHVNPCKHGAVVAPPTPLSAIIIPAYARGGGTFMEDVPRPEVLELLFDQTMNAPIHGADLLPRLADVVGAVPCLRLVMDDLTGAVRLLNEFVARRLAT